MNRSKNLATVLIVLLTCSFWISFSLSKVELTKGASPNLLVNGDFETGTHDGWTTTGTAGIDNTIVHSGSYSAYVSDYGLNNKITQVIYPTQRLPVEAGLTIEGWVYPLMAGKMPAGPEWPVSGIWVDFFNESAMGVDHYLIYTWSMSEVYHNWTNTGVFFIPDLMASNWNFISRNITQDLYAYFGGAEHTELVLYAIEPFYHYSSASPGPFYVDDLAVYAGGEIPPPPVIAKVSLQPETTTASISNSFNVQAIIENATSLYSWQLEIFYSRSIINSMNATEGSFLNSSGSTVFLSAFNNDYNATHGRLLVAGSFLGENPGVNGSGILATLTFRAIAVGNSVLYARTTGTVLFDSHGKQIAPINVKNGWVLVKWCADLNGDGKVDIRDIVIVAIAYGSYLGGPRWNPVADLNKDNFVDIRDIAMVARDFGKTL